MNGLRYYTLRMSDAEFFALDSTNMDRAQLDWLEQRLDAVATPERPSVS